MESAVRANATYADFKNWNVQQLGFTSVGGGTYDVYVPKDGFLSISLAGANVAHSHVYAIVKGGTAVCVASSVGTDFWDDCARYISTQFSCFVKAGNTFRITGGLPGGTVYGIGGHSLCYLFYP